MTTHHGSGPDTSSGTGPDTGDALHIGVDVGGTKVLAGEVDVAGTVRRTARRATPGRRVDPAHVEQALTEAVDEVAAGRPVAAVGLAAAGFVDGAGERVLFAPHLPWQGEAVRERLEQRWSVPVAMDNDANCAARAEAALGAARGVPDFLLVTMGTGIGGAVVLDGRVHRGRNGMAGEFGHAQLVPEGRPCECGGRGCWEQYASGHALVRAARRRGSTAVAGPEVTAAALAGDPVALEAFGEVGAWLGVGVANLVAAFDPPLVVVGGGVSAADLLLLEPARAAVARSLVGAAHRRLPEVVRARFGPEAGVVGAALLARDHLG